MKRLVSDTGPLLHLHEAGALAMADDAEHKRFVSNLKDECQLLDAAELRA
jgi:hypothetical protein